MDERRMRFREELDDKEIEALIQLVFPEPEPEPKEEPKHYYRRVRRRTPPMAVIPWRVVTGREDPPD